MCRLWLLFLAGLAATKQATKENVLTLFGAACFWQGERVDLPATALKCFHLPVQSFHVRRYSGVNRLTCLLRSVLLQAAHAWTCEVLVRGALSSLPLGPVERLDCPECIQQRPGVPPAVNLCLVRLQFLDVGIEPAGLCRLPGR